MILLGPSLLVWLVRGGAYAAHCAPGPEFCHGMMLGGMQRAALTLAWWVAGDTTILFALALVAAIAALFMRRPVLAALSLLVLPLVALILPMVAVDTAMPSGCVLSEAGVGECVLWGAPMGMSFHNAAAVTGAIYGFAPYSFAVALMIGIVGWFVTRPKQRGHATASQPHRFPDGRFPRRD